MAGTATYSTRLGTYRKEGKQCRFTIDMVYAGFDGTGFLTITGLPFTSEAARTAVSIWSTNIAYAGDGITGYVGASGTTIVLSTPSTGAGASLPVDAAGTLLISGVYGTV